MGLFFLYYIIVFPSIFLFLFFLTVVLVLPHFSSLLLMVH